VIGAKVEINFEIPIWYHRLYLAYENNYFPQQYSVEKNDQFIKHISHLTQRIRMINHHLHTEFPNYQDFKIIPFMLTILQNFSMCTSIFGK